MPPKNPSRAMLPKGLYGIPYDKASGPKTPEPMAHNDEFQLPSPLRPRLRVKKRHASHHLNAPTRQFLASVEAADVPLPSIEADLSMVGEDILDRLPEFQVGGLDDMDILEHLHARTCSPPKTPAIELAQPLSTSKYPDWSIDSEWSSSDVESSPEYESSRPSTAFSTHTSASLFSQYSHASEACISPGVDTLEFPNSDFHANASISHKESSRKAPWTKAMSSHLWATYLLYLQDPRVTPVRLGRSRIPPNGVCSRVAREARRSWKGSKGRVAADAESESSTPTAESTKPYIEWPHTCAATRAHLRELCRLKASSSPRNYVSPSPAPLNRAVQRRRNRISTPGRSPSVFSGQEMAFSLALSTLETMQPEGPLAQLTCSENDPLHELAADASPETTVTQEPPLVEVPYLPSPSPVSAKSYGPSSSSSLTVGISLPRQSNTVGFRRTLQSPVRLTRSRSGTQKRRSVKSLDDLPRKRPSLSSDFWKEAAGGVGGMLRQQQQHQHTGISFESDKAEDPFSQSSPRSGSSTPLMIPVALPRLGSPFSGTGSSHSFPNRISNPIDFNPAALRRPFATVRQSAQARSTTPSSPRSTLASRLAYLDQRLKELRNRRSERRRSQSPL
ncbi:hypothetical protein GGS23DRAFT_90316 [Durotheca rogersii]|uniref:uncharacterized protein n=1 Tax=Durotheca rogersii TaxID=419775 RepID=UPI00221E8C09|nr:uncharacterized protein GGS23DRAFT_90316 [Durotheca rogersii]KAI5862722.1 hypothetical protein GGS23DRAFT_90316 [Durotheca rogersii]